jgi:phosphatidylglycerophosphatase A
MIVFIAQGFGVGRIPFAPGTFGSLVGLVWFAALLVTGRYELYLLGALCGAGLSVWLCGAAEKILKQKDPPSVVLDEIIALPFCFLPWVTAQWLRNGKLPALETFLSVQHLLAVAAIFIVFRVFDILKPWPVRQSQHLPGGWGVTVDDLLAAVYVAMLSLLFVR